MFLSRLAEMTGSPRWREAADHTFLAFLRPGPCSGPYVVRVDARGYYWLEEWPWAGMKPDATLNGHNSSAFGLYEYHMVTGDERRGAVQGRGHDHPPLSSAVPEPGLDQLLLPGASPSERALPRHARGPTAPALQTDRRPRLRAGGRFVQPRLSAPRRQRQTAGRAWRLQGGPHRRRRDARRAPHRHAPTRSHVADRLPPPAVARLARLSACTLGRDAGGVVAAGASGQGLPDRHGGGRSYAPPRRLSVAAGCPFRLSRSMRTAACVRVGVSRRQTACASPSIAAP